MEAPVKPINKRAEVASSVFGEIERMISAPQAGFEIAQNRVDPVEFRQVLGLAATCDDGSVLALGIGYPGKTAQAINSGAACLGSVNDAKCPPLAGGNAPRKSGVISRSIRLVATA